PGNLKFGQQAYHRVPRKIAATTPDDYPALANSVLAGEIPGSSAGGEQPKFTTYCGVQSAHVIVKFSPKGDDPIARRWKDILITEHHAAETLREAGIAAAAATQLIEKEGRLFLESQRFDRSGKDGRLSMLSLQSIGAEFVGFGEGWFPVISALYKANLISAQHVSETLYLSLFGLMINNTDMHLGNLSLGIDGDVFRLLPVYDMCSMGFAPKAGEATPFQFSLPSESQLKLSSLNINNTLKAALATAVIFWETIAADPRISPEFKSFLAKDNPLNQIKQALKSHLK
ncbi:MAG: HipA domain-containing protein, partial [Ghiorsea sp.]|nr:HipA domain-containing protein [Ghiorsea sp.]